MDTLGIPRGETTCHHELGGWVLAAYPSQELQSLPVGIPGNRAGIDHAKIGFARSAGRLVPGRGQKRAEFIGLGLVDPATEGTQKILNCKSLPSDRFADNPQLGCQPRRDHLHLPTSCPRGGPMPAILP